MELFEKTSGDMFLELEDKIQRGEEINIKKQGFDEVDIVEKLTKTQQENIQVIFKESTFFYLDLNKADSLKWKVGDFSFDHKTLASNFEVTPI